MHLRAARQEDGERSWPVCSHQWAVYSWQLPSWGVELSQHVKAADVQDQGVVAAHASEAGWVWGKLGASVLGRVSRVSRQNVAKWLERGGPWGAW